MHRPRCNHPSSGPWEFFELKPSNKGKKRKLKDLENVEDSVESKKAKFYCDICNQSLTSKKRFEKHLSSKKHIGRTSKSTN